MSTRALLRGLVRAAAAKQGYKPSEAVKVWWDEHQINKVGIEARKANQESGTHKKYIFKKRPKRRRINK